MRIRTLIVDDEPLARERLRTLLRSEPDIEIVGECGDGRKAVSAIQKQRPHLIFLDVQMPEMDGFGVLRAVDAEVIPEVIFVTAYDRYALQAFDIHALDYLLKPFDRERFRRALDRARKQLTGEKDSLNRRLLALLEDMKAGERRRDRLVIKTSGRVFFLPADEIDWIEAAGNYVRLHVGKETHLLRDTIGGMEQRLHPEKFVRIHRSTIVNLERVKELQPWFHGDYVVLLHDSTRLTLTRNYREKLRQALRHPL